jgi:uncharacterized membrane protein/mono/diheme cytochrome c family protein
MFEHPIHSIFVHFPAGLIPTSVIFFVLYLYFRKQIFELISILLLNVSILFIFLAIVTGIYDWQIRYNGYFIPPIMIKFYLSFIILLLGVLIYILRKQRTKSKNSEPLYKYYGYISLYFVLLPLVVIIGYFGGELVFHSSSMYENYKINEGSKLYFLKCNSCHPFGQGISSAFIFPGDSAGVFGSPNLINSNLLLNKEIFKEYVRHPKRMPAFPEKSITNDELNQIFDFVMFLKKGNNNVEVQISEKISVLDTIANKTAKKINSIDTMKRGENIFVENCASCHPNGGNSIDGSEKYKIIGSQRIKASTANFIDFIRNTNSRIKNSAMPEFSEKDITGKDVEILQKYLVKKYGK